MRLSAGSQRRECQWSVVGLIWAIAVGLSLFAGAAPAEAQRTVSIQPPSTTAYVGDTFTLTVNVDDATGVAGFQFDLSYDGALMTFASPPHPGSLLSGLGWVVQANQVNPNLLRVLGYSPSATALAGGSGPLVALDFSAAALGTTPVALPSALLGDTVGNPIPAVGVDGSVTVTCPGPQAAFSGTPTSGCTPLEVCFTDASTGDPTSWSWSFGDGGTSTEQHPCHTYAAPGAYTVSLTATNACGTDTETKAGYIQVGGPPTADFSGTPTSGCAPLEVCFTDGSTGSPTSWSWSFGDGGTSAERNPCHTYAAPGAYTVSLTATNGCGSDSETKAGYIQVGGPPTAAFSGTPTSGCAPLEVCFTDASTGNPTSWSWSFGDGGTSTEQNPCNTYDTPGSYTVSLTVANACGSDTEMKEHYITVGGPPTAAFSGTPTSGCAPLEVCFTDASTGTPTSWSWAFGDGGTSGAQNPCHTYNAPGSYTVSLTVTNACGSDNETKAGYLQVGGPPTAAFSGTPTSGCAPLEVCFTDASTGSPTSWSWSFGDGSTSTESDPCHAYTASGSYTVTLTVCNDCGCDTETKEDYVAVLTPPVADFSASPTDGCLPLEVSFTDESTGEPAAWSWDFGDGGTSTAQHPDHTYLEVGFYEVTLIVTTADCSDSETKARYVAVGFPDTCLPEWGWAIRQIIACYEADIVRGYWDDTYRPGEPVTRDQMAVYIARALAGGDANVPPGPATPTFTDVPTDYWAYKHVEYAHAQNVVGGYWDGTYRPEEIVNRAQMAVFVARGRVAPNGDAAIPPGPETPTFPDVPIDHWAYKWVEYCYAQGVVGGYPDGTYHPDETVNRAQMAVYVQRAFGL